MDCEESCPMPDKMSAEPQVSFEIYGIDVLTILSAISFCLILSAFTGFVCFNGNSF